MHKTRNLASMLAMELCVSASPAMADDELSGPGMGD
ncbi:MAG: hypothetical protein ACJAXR_002943 [Halopseudomonas sp.]|jgi:hypothetical protein